ncbi:mediator of RNA polymerase II transcription subunit 27 [Chlorella sorokiniana]|uniref:Mediator of RNA polymerase II transcription subunit 27 n=1 Tax=Chlorella sorokiniana TaxID=3076 RepID=A0A2P6TR22_CHLSO|nr:mediator of RNA polymerase II transcription subunit 27 [Chlorella sorokiniana]|eukprot:PRW56514.1 mediator of RNA polymerase II transcription subunit 27 [Chlorella sorokiniana]
MVADPTALLATVAQAQQQLAQLEATAKGLIDELAASGGTGATPRLRELLANGERLVASVAQAGQQLGSVLPPSSAALPPAPDAAAVEAVWAQHAQQDRGAALLSTPVTRPAPSLAELQYSLAYLPSCRLQLLQGRQPTDSPAHATAMLLRCGRAFAAVVHLQQPGSLQPLRVGVLSAAEADTATSGGGSSGSTISLWAPSQHEVYRQLSAQAAAALQHFLAQQQQQQQAGSMGAASPLELLLLWLVTCSDVFTRPSTSSGTLLLADPAAVGGGLLPPLHRPWQLGWDQLWQAALNPRLRQAEHVGATES